MNRTYELLAGGLKEQNVKLSNRRMKVLKYLSENQHHPTVDQIYNGLLNEVPNLSKTTVYSTLRTLMEAGLVKVINIEDNETRYDVVTETHGHFKCEDCGTILNFAVDIQSFSTEELKGFKIVDRNVYFKGVCPKCLQKTGNAKINGGRKNGRKKVSGNGK
jgi:Fe2+ or Zn2+ uptake regulation protein